MRLNARLIVYGSLVGMSLLVLVLLRSQDPTSTITTVTTITDETVAETTAAETTTTERREERTRGGGRGGREDKDDDDDDELRQLRDHVARLQQQLDNLQYAETLRRQADEANAKTTTTDTTTTDTMMMMTDTTTDTTTTMMTMNDVDTDNHDDDYHPLTRTSTTITIYDTTNDNENDDAKTVAPNPNIVHEDAPDDFLTNRDTFLSVIEKELQLDPQLEKLFPTMISRIRSLPDNDWNVQFRYPEITIPLPIFFTQRERKIHVESEFFSNGERVATVDGDCVHLSGDYFQAGQIAVLRNVSFNKFLPETCGWMSDAKYLDQHASNPVHYLDRAAVIMVPQSESFQLFINGVVPKIAHSWPMSKYFQLITAGASHNILENIVRHVGMEPLPFDGKTYFVKELLSVCRAPGVHPEPLRLQHHILSQRYATQLPPPTRYKIVYFPRGTKDVHNGRLVENEAEVIEKLREIAASRNLDMAVFESSSLHGDVVKLIEFFHNSVLLVGAHGGAFYNAYFAPLSVGVFEMIPESLRMVSRNMIWLTSTMLGMPYWRMYSPSVRGNNIRVDLAVLESSVHSILDTLEDRDAREKIRNQCKAA